MVGHRLEGGRGVGVLAIPPDKDAAHPLSTNCIIYFKDGHCIYKRLFSRKRVKCHLEDVSIDFRGAMLRLCCDRFAPKGQLDILSQPL